VTNTPNGTNKKNGQDAKPSLKKKHKAETTNKKTRRSKRRHLAKRVGNEKKKPSNPLKLRGWTGHGREGGGSLSQRKKIRIGTQKKSGEKTRVREYLKQHAVLKNPLKSPW